MTNYKIEIKWAFIFIGMTLLWMLLEKLSGLHSTYIDYHLYLTNLYAIPAILVYVFALIDKKKNFYEGQMTYMKGLVAGVIITLIVALFSPLTQWIISYVISPEYFPNVIKRSVEIGYYPTTEEAEAHFNFKNYAVQSVIGALVMGLVTTLIVMLFVRTKKNRNGER
ncbi:MAG: DUF4199 domain-containing protein [Bacteroidetes bacterium HGW-Bacteroidetes-15]|nr:MAG: DUF4199 domain-containing protein [Bacteroidetes bacterium HGW-Bacteroidetes-15]